MQDKLKADLVASMKAGDVLRTLVLRMLLSELNYKKIDLGRELTDVDVIGVVQKEVKKRREAIESFKAGGRVEQAETEAKELEILEKYVPKQMSEEEIRQEVIKLIKLTQDRSNFGAVMKVVAPEFRGKADGSVVAKIVKEMLG
jgi:uncharacterized protein